MSSTGITKKKKIAKKTGVGKIPGKVPGKVPKAKKVPKKIQIKGVGPLPKKIPVEEFSWVNSGKYIDPDTMIDPNTLKTMMLPNVNRFPYYIVDEYNKYLLSEDFSQDCEERDNIEAAKQATFPIFNFQKGETETRSIGGSWYYQEDMSQAYEDDWYYFQANPKSQKTFHTLIDRLIGYPNLIRLNVPLDIEGEDMVTDPESGEYIGFYTTTPKLFVATSMFPYQQFVRDYMNYNTPYRGILLYHGLGAGKTRASIEIAKAYKKKDPNTEIVFMAPAALVDNFVQELQQWGAISMDDYLSFKRFKRSDTPNRRRFLQRLGYYIVHYNAPDKDKVIKALRNPETGKIENKVIIVDEVHNLINMIHNKFNPGPGQRKPSEIPFYDLLYNCVNCRLVFLSGTPMINNPSELGILFNLLRGPLSYRDMVDIQGEGTAKYMEEVPKQAFETNSFKESPYGGGREEKTYELFPTDREEFYKYFVDVNNPENPLRNPDIFKRRILGLVSYYSGAKGDIFPDIINQDERIVTDNQFPWILQQVPMSMHQLRMYEEERERERRQRPRAKKVIPKKAFPKKVGVAAAKQPGPAKIINPQLAEEILNAITGREKSNSFRVKSRQISNFALPGELQELRPSNLSDQDDFLAFMNNLDEMGGEGVFDPRSLEENSPKMKAALDNIVEFIRSGEPGNVLVYSNFRSAEGIEYFARILEQYGFEYYNPTQDGRVEEIQNLLLETKNLANSEVIKQVILQTEDLDTIWSLCRTNKLMHEICRTDEEIKTHLGTLTKGAPRNRFAILGKDRRAGGGDYTTEIIDYFNSPENADGSRIKILLGTANMSEGLNLFNIRQVHILEPHWNMVRIKQTIGRARRVCSHKALDPEFWNFKVYLYLSGIPEEFGEWTEDEISTDEVIYEIAARKELIKNRFIHLMKEAAVDCILNASHNENLLVDPKVNCVYYGKDIPFTNDIQYTYYPDLEDDRIFLSPIYRQWQTNYNNYIDTINFVLVNIQNKNYWVPEGVLLDIRLKANPNNLIKKVRPLYDEIIYNTSGIPHLRGYYLPNDQIVQPDEVLTVVGKNYI